jgi:hypothetical protein
MAQMNSFNSALRFLIEIAALVIFGIWGFHLSDTWMLNDLGYRILLWIYTGAVFIHYLLSYRRINWLLKQ